FAVDLLAPIPDMIRPQMQVVFDESVKIFVAGLAVPQDFIAEMHERGMIVIVMIGKVRHALKSEQAGADIVAAQGTGAGCYTGKPARTIRNRYNEEWERKAEQIQPFPTQIMHSIQEGVMNYQGIAGDADPDRTFMPAGQGMGLIRAIKPAAEVLADIVHEA